MFGLNYEQIISKIQEEKGIPIEEIEKKVEAKVKSLSDLISREGAAHIVAHDLGVKVFVEPKKRKLKIKDLIAGLSSANIVGKVVALYGVRSFKNEQREGRLATLLLGDESGVIRLVFWDDTFITQIENGKIREGDILSIRNAYSRTNNGFLELHLGGKASLEVNPEGEEIDHIALQEDLVKPLARAKDGERIIAQGTVVQVFEPRFYPACPECSKKVVLVLDKYQCQEHGIVKEVHMPIFNFFLDDGSESIRVACFRESVKKLLGDDVVKFKEDISGFEEMRKDLLGKQLRITGRVTKNDFFDYLELRAQRIEELDALTFAQEMITELVK